MLQVLFKISFYCSIFIYFKLLHAEKNDKLAVAVSFHDWNLLSQVRGFTHGFWAVICVLI